MAQPELKTMTNVVERNITWVGEIMHYLLNNPQVFSSLPSKLIPQQLSVCWRRFWYISSNCGTSLSQP